MSAISGSGYDEKGSHCRIIALDADWLCYQRAWQLSAPGLDMGVLVGERDLLEIKTF